MDSALEKSLKQANYSVLKVKDSELVKNIIEKLGITFLYDDLTPEYLLIKNQKAIFVKNIFEARGRYFLSDEQGERIIYISSNVKKCLMLSGNQFLNINTAQVSKLLDIVDIKSKKAKSYIFGKIIPISIKDLDNYL